MIDPRHKRLSISRQCALLGLARSSAYYRSKPMASEELELMRRIDALYTEFPFFGSRQMARMLRREGRPVGRKRVQRLMRVMALEAQCPKPNLSRPAPGHKVYPYLMRGQTIDGPNQAWCSDITYIPLAEGFAYLVAVMDWHSRKVLAWELSNSLDTAFCTATLERALADYGPPRIMNTDQGCQFTSEAWTGLLHRHDVKISMDGRGRALDNVFVERLWRSLKYEEVYRREYAGLADARRHIGHYFKRYNERRPHSSLGDKTPAEAHAAAQPAAA
jgi:putative transposase